MGGNIQGDRYDINVSTLYISNHTDIFSGNVSKLRCLPITHKKGITHKKA